MERRVLITGCSGGGKSTLLLELARRGFRTVEEPGRRIIAEQRRTGGTAMPWIDLGAFARQALIMAKVDHAGQRNPEAWVFFDRGIVDAAVALAHATGRPPASTAQARRYHRQVFVAPPWPEIFGHDPDRRHDAEDAVSEYHRIGRALRMLAYEAIELPRCGVEERASFVLDTLS